MLNYGHQRRYSMVDKVFCRGNAWRLGENLHFTRFYGTLMNNKGKVASGNRLIRSRLLRGLERISLPIPRVMQKIAAGNSHLFSNKKN